MSAGVRTMARLLRSAAEAPTSAAEVAASEELPRSTVFEVAARLEAAGLLRREGGQLVPGPAALRLGFAAHGLAALCGPAEAILRQLQNETGADAVLIAEGGDVLRLCLRRDRPAGQTIGLPVDNGRARVEVCLGPNATRAERLVAEAAVGRARVSLEHYLRGSL